MNGISSEPLATTGLSVVAPLIITPLSNANLPQTLDTKPNLIVSLTRPDDMEKYPAVVIVCFGRTFAILSNCIPSNVKCYTIDC